jgi:hypothetical protein
MDDQRERELLEILRKLPDFDRLPLPKYLYTKYNIPEPKIQSLMESLKHYDYIQNMPGDGILEIREPAAGGVRPLIEVKPLELEVKNEALEDKQGEGQSS